MLEVILWFGSLFSKFGGWMFWLISNPLFWIGWFLLMGGVISLHYLLKRKGAKKRSIPPPPQQPPIGGNPSNGNDDNSKKFTVLYWISIIIALLLYLIILGTGFYHTKDNDEKWWILSGAIVVFHISLSTLVINEKQLGAMFILGHSIGDLVSGVYFAFWPLCYVRRETKNIVQLEIGVLTEEERKKAATLENSASVYLLEEPLRVNWGDMRSANPTTEEEEIFKGNPYADAMVTDTHITMRFRISSLTRLIKKAGTLDECLELMRGVVVSTLISHAGKSFVGRVIHNMEDMDEKLKKAIEEFVVDQHSQIYTTRPEDSWGIDVEKTQITRLGTSKRVNVAIADKGEMIYKAQGERIKLQEVGAGTAKAIELKAQADQVRLTKEGIGNAKAAKLLMFARQEGTAKLAEVASTPEGLIILQLEALEKALSAGKAVVIPMEFSKILGALGNKLIP